MQAIRAWFCIAAALVAASVADPLVEFASNRGVFGPGSFTDHSNRDVLPALCAGLAFGAVYVLLRARSILARRDVEVIRSNLRRFARRPAVWSLLPHVFLAQIAILFGMETVEQFVVAGHSLGGAVWLGGPPLASLAAHGASCVLATFLLARLARHLSQQTATVVAHLIAAIALVPRSRAVAFLRLSHRSGAQRRVALLGRIGERAPPQPAA